MTYEDATEQVTVNSVRYQKYFGLIAGVCFVLACVLVFFAMPPCFTAGAALSVLIHFVTLCFICFAFCILMSMSLYTKTHKITIIRPGVQLEVSKMFLSSFVWVALFSILCTGIVVAAMIWLSHIVWLCYLIYILVLGANVIVTGSYILTAAFYILFEVRRRWITKYPEVVMEEK